MMEFLTENWFFVLVALGCLGMHFMGHGHRHNDHHPGKGPGGGRGDGALGSNGDVLPSRPTAEHDWSARTSPR